MRYSTEPRDPREPRFLSFPKIMGAHLINKYCQKLLDSARKSTKDAIRNA